MKKEYSQPFLQAAEVIAEKVFGSSVEKSNISLEKTLLIDKEVIVALGIKGQLNGIVLFGLTQEEAVNLAAKVLSEQGISGYNEWDELTQSALLEFGNQVVGYVTELYGEQGIICDITTPSFIKKEQLKNYERESIRFEMKNSIANIVVKLHISEN